MAGDFSKPQTTSAYTNYSSEIRDIAADLAKMLDGTGTQNTPSGAIRWSSTNNRFEKLAGTSWAALTAGYTINVDTVDGCHAGTSAGNVLVLDTNGKVPLGNIPTPLTGIDADTLDGKHASSFDQFPAGTKMVFFQAAAPTGWTKDATHNDKALRVVSGTGGGSGGAHALSTPPTTTHTHATANHVLTVNEMPAHTHEMKSDATGAPTGAGAPDAYFGQGATSLGWTEATGGGAAHNHGATDGGTLTAFAPRYIDVIVCTKN